MGGNNSHSDEYGGVPPIKRAYYEHEEKILGHKILVSNKNIYHKTPVPMNSNTPNATYLCGHVDKKTGVLVINHIARYKGHYIEKSVDIGMDSNGALVMYPAPHGTHQHNFVRDSDGRMGRKTHNSSNTFPVDESFMSLIKKICEFNNAKKQWKKK